MNQATSEKIVAYFDFDGTITTKDTLLPFLLHTVGYIKFFIKFPVILPILILYKLRMISNEIAKERTLGILLKGKSREFLEDKAQNFAYTKIDQYIQPLVFSKLEYHQEHKHTIIIVSANLAIYLRYWIERHKIDNVIATELEFIDGYFNGRLATHNCYGQEKVKRINSFLQQQHKHFSYSYGYGNSRGDYELLQLVDEAYFINDGMISPWKSHGSG